MKKLGSFIISHKHTLLVSAGLLLVSAIILSLPSVAQASLADDVTNLLANIFSGLVWIVGKILILLITLVIWVAQYNDFIGSPAVTNGWTILRDVCNMFFILILLVIAFATTLNIENYGMKRLLKDFIIAAILINFSKLICGVIIDFAQVIMLTFVNGFRDIGGGNLADMLGVSQILSISASECGDNISNLAILGTYILAFVYVVVASVVILAILFTLIMRIVMLWIYVVTSPLAYLLSVLPATKKYAGQWWSQFSEAVASGPILAFFIWLAFASATIGSRGQDIVKVQRGSAGVNEQGYIDQFSTGEATCAGLSEAGTPDGMLKFIISIGLLIGGLMITKQAGGMVGGVAGSALGKLQGWGKKLGTGAMKGTTRLAGRAGLMTAKATGRGALNLSGKAVTAAGKKLSTQGYAGIGTTLQGAGKFATDWRADLKKTRDEAKAKKRQKILEKLGIKDKGQAALQDWSKKSPVIGKMAASALAGAPLAGALTPISFLGGKAAGGIKNWMSNWQRQADVKQTGKTVEKLENKVSGAYKDKSRAMSMYDQEEKKEKERVQKQWDSDKQNPLIKYNVNQKYQAEMDDVTEKYKKNRDDAEETYKKNATPKQQRDDANNAANLETAKRHHEEAKVMATYIEKKGEVKTAKDDHKDKVRDLENNRNLEIRNAKVNFKGNALDGELKRINTKYDAEADSLRKNHDTEIKTINDKYQSLENINMHGPIRKPINWGGKVVQAWNPNSVTELALKKGTKEFSDAHNIVAALIDKQPLERFKFKNFTDAAANGGLHEKLYEELAEDSSNSKGARQSLVEMLQVLKTKAGGPNKEEKEVVEGIKQGIARHYTNKPENKSAFSTIISELDSIDTGKPGKVKVSDFEPKTK